MTTPPKPAASAAVLIAGMICGTVVLLGIVGGIVALVNTTSTTGTDVVPILTALGIAAAGVAGQVLNYIKSRSIEHGQQVINTKVDYLANGGTDAKVRAGIADVVRPEFLRDDSGDQIAADRVHRDASPASGHATTTAEVIAGEVTDPPPAG